MLIYPTLDLFSYHIREGLGQSENEVEKNRQYFKQQLPAEITQQIDQSDIQGDYVELLGKNGIHRFEEAIYSGYYYPVRLNDSYGLLLDSSCRDHQSSDDLQWISGLKQSIEGKLPQKPTLGQTWVFYASVLQVPLEEYDLIAQQCYQMLLPHADWSEDQTGSCEFMGGKLFEFWQESGDTAHVIIILFANETGAESIMPNLIQDQLRWFWYRHKITWAYAQSRQLERLLKNQSIEIKKLFDDFHQKSPGILENANRILQSYFELLSSFEAQVHTIETNLHNYQKRVSKVQQRVTALNFPDTFEQRTREKYLLQLQRDRAAFGLQLELIKNVIASVQARETHHNVKQMVMMHRKVEWLEVFFASYYGAALAYYLKCDYIWIIVGALLGGILALWVLKPWKHQHQNEY